MNIQKARRIVYDQEHQLDGSKRMNTQTVSREYAYVEAKGFIAGYEAGVRDAGSKTADMFGVCSCGCEDRIYKLLDEMGK